MFYFWKDKGILMVDVDGKLTDDREQAVLVSDRNWDNPIPVFMSSVGEDEKYVTSSNTVQYGKDLVTFVVAASPANILHYSRCALKVMLVLIAEQEGDFGEWIGETVTQGIFYMHGGTNAKFEYSTMGRIKYANMSARVRAGRGKWLFKTFDFSAAFGVSHRFLVEQPEFLRALAIAYGCKLGKATISSNSFMVNSIIL